MPKVRAKTGHRSSRNLKLTSNIQGETTNPALTVTLSTMNRSPYHLAAHTRPPTSRRRQRSEITGSCVTVNQHSVSRRAQHVGANVVNPMVQPMHGAYGSRYLSSRSMGLSASAAADSILQHAQHTQQSHHENVELPMFSHVHPLQQRLTHTQSKSGSVQSQVISSHLTSRQSLPKTLLNTLRKQFYSIVSNLQNKDVDFLCLSSTSKSKRSIRNYSHQGFMWMVIPLILILGLQKVGIIPSHTKLFHLKKQWDRLEDRSLENRQCVMNLFVHKQKPDEFNPDWVDPKKVDPKKPPGSVVVEGTHRTKGQLKLINRFISSVADSFRSNTRLKQHVLFLGSRDGGHLAQEALQHWPPRGSYQTQLHVFGEKGKDELEYEYLNELENRFEKAKSHVHLYDWYGNIAGGPPDDDDEEEDDDDGLFGQRKKKKRRTKKLEDSNEDKDGELERDELPEVKNLLFDSLFQQDEESEEKDDDSISDEQRRLRDNPMFDTIIPYMHVDGISMEHQLNTLDKTISLLEDRKIVAVGVEHTPDMDVKELIAFFTKLHYKTFMLGLRQLTRIDNLCEEMLDNIYDHPYLENSKKSKSLISKLFSAAGSAFGDEPTLEQANTPRYPPFFIAMPKGRLQKEEMTIQHMYDLFSGAGGGGQVKTANDRKAPGK